LRKFAATMESRGVAQAIADLRFLYWLDVQ